MSRQAQIAAADFLSYLPETEDLEHSAVSRHSFFLPPVMETVRLETFTEALAGIAVPDSVDLMSIDVEGHELNVLRSIPFDQYCFRAIVVETQLLDDTRNQCKWKHRDLAEMEGLLARFGYQPTTRTSVNTIYCRAG